ncbi:MAG: helix-turn-helix transcriptional regulator [Bacillota bacterium]|nr:helix-turn-helix transcriptional regulator [Bacillota bacterium]
MSENKKQAACEIEVAFSVIGGKWKPIILWFLGEFNTLRFGQIHAMIPNITHRILTKQLRELEDDNIISRKVFPEVPLKVEYSITENGKKLLPIFEMMCSWASDNNYFGYEILYNLCDEDIKEKLLNCEEDKKL